MILLNTFLSYIEGYEEEKAYCMEELLQLEKKLLYTLGELEVHRYAHGLLIDRERNRLLDRMKQDLLDQYQQVQYRKHQLEILLQKIYFE